MSSSPARQSDVRLVLLIAVDQFRYDYLSRFRADHSDGLARLQAQGAVFSNANLEHYPTVTAIGHATMLSGATPSASGIIGNDWFDREAGKSVASIEDPSVQPVGSDTGSAASPRRLLVATIGDELKLASPLPRGDRNAPRVVGVSLNDDSAILSTGWGADGAYWWDPKSGRFVTSTFYRVSLPDWASAFNDRKVADRQAGAQWTLFTSPATVLRQFPAEAGPELYEAVSGSPSGNDMVADFALELLKAEELGRRDATDLLVVSLSSNDTVGHAYGPDSLHVRDISLKTDRVIGRLLREIESSVGLECTIVVFTSDHGVAPLPELLESGRVPGGRMTSEALFDPIRQALSTRFGGGEWIAGTSGSSPYLNHALIESRGLDPVELRKVAAAAAMKVPHVAEVYTRDDLLRGAVRPTRVGQRVLRSFHAQRSGDLEIILEPYWMRDAAGTTHGTPYDYDAHIPLILMGPGIEPGNYAGAVALNDLAPTLATLVSVAIPGGSSGRVLTEAFGRRRAAPPDRSHP